MIVGISTCQHISIQCCFKGTLGKQHANVTFELIIESEVIKPLQVAPPPRVPRYMVLGAMQVPCIRF